MNVVNKVVSYKPFAGRFPISRVVLYLPFAVYHPSHIHVIDLRAV
jgi:hypothetical protein